MDQAQFIRITEGEIDTAYALSALIPEFDPPYSWKKWQERLAGRESLVLTAYISDKPVGFKVGIMEAGHFYSWVGGVLPEWRRQGIAKKLAERQESNLQERGVETIRMNTRNKFKAMLIFALSHGFDIVDTYPGPGTERVSETRIILEKKI
jgi:ribosomal protein S18 acetylase RimI-like enzyme